MGDMINDVGSIIRAKRKEKGISQREFAEKLGTSQNAIHNWETGKRQPKFARLVTIATVLEEPVHTFCPELTSNQAITIGKRIKRLRKEKEITQKELAKKTGIAEITIRQYEAGKYNPKLANVEKIAKALDVCTSDLVSSSLVSVDALTDIINDEIVKADEMLANLTADDDIFAIRYHKICCQDMLNKVKELPLKGWCQI